MNASGLSRTISFLLTFVFIGYTFSQNPVIRNGIFLHHSTGGNIWGPNGSNTSVPQQIQLYNQAHGYTGSQAVSMTETWFPAYNDNEWSTWHTIFTDAYPEDICNYCPGNPILMIKSCYPCSSIVSEGQPSDTLNPTLKSVYNYKWHWRNFVSVMAGHPEHFFVIWTNAPLVQNATNYAEAQRSHRFSKWAKDTLAAGLDPVYGPFPPNVYVFDYFHKVANAQGFLNPVYAVSAWDSHPNAAATQLVAPQLVNETFDAAIAYETLLGLADLGGTVFYDNADSTPLAGVKVYLKVGCCTIADSSITDGNGSFSFPALAPGFYRLEPATSIAWGGVNSDDALLILKHFVSLIALTGLREEAANLDGNHIINATDALMAARRFVGLIYGFPSGDWIFENMEVLFDGSSNVQVEIKGLCYGDVNGSRTVF
ncbi:MAG TPA: hypothetical protein P5531_06460 [Bacteroidales bacterium]|nr:hypothetical protein [Bacteroidales bacterium]HSA43721.1 hypothetical protein [Bacteroidales bacterium]